MEFICVVKPAVLSRSYMKIKFNITKFCATHTIVLERLDILTPQIFCTWVKIFPQILENPKRKKKINLSDCTFKGAICQNSQSVNSYLKQISGKTHFTF